MIFVLLFLVLNSLFKILHVVICGVGGLTKERNNTLTRTLGAIIGAIQAIAIVGIILLPAVGAASVIEDSVTAIQKEDSKSKVITVYNTYVKEYSKNKILAIYDACGIGALYEGISEVSVDGKQVKMTRLAPDIANIYSEATTLSGSDWRKLPPESQEKLRDIATLVEENAYVSNVAAGAIRSLSKVYQGGSLQLVKEGYLAEAMNEAVKIFEDTSVDTLYEDLDTILTVYFILCNENVIYSIESGTDALLTALTTKDAEDKTAINRIVDVLKENERTKPILSVVTKITVSAMYGELGITEETEAMYESVKEGLTDVLTLDKESFSDEAEFSAAVNESIGSTLASSGIEIEQEMIDTMSEYVVENYDELSLNADESFDTLLFYYYDAYIEYINSGTMPPEIPELSPEG